MNKLIYLVTICLICQLTQAQERLKNSTEGYNFQINYWLNLHHFLWMESFMNVEKDSSVIGQKISKDAQNNLNIGLEYYKKNLIQLNLRSDDYMTDFKHWISAQDSELNSVPPKFKEHVNILKVASEGYKSSLWQKHKKACEKVLIDNIELIRRTEKRFAIGIIKLTRQNWQMEKIKVDITYFGTATTWNFEHRPYATLFPTHLVMTAYGDYNVKGNWVETLYHEASHHLILGSSGFVGGTINDVSEVLDIKPPRSFWHSYLFYFTGELAKEIFIKEELTYKSTYMERSGVYGRYYGLLNKHLKSYMKREITLEEATKLILIELNKK